MAMHKCFLQSALALALLSPYFCPHKVMAEKPVYSSIPAAEEVEEYYITCNPDDFAYIYEHFSEDIYVPATIVHRDQTWTNVQMRLRGDSSREFPKKSLKFKTDGAPFANGRDVLNFNAEYLDNSFIHSILCSKLFADMNYPGFHAEAVRVYLNNTFLGLYISIENMDAAFLAAHSLDPKGNLYKATYDGACLSRGEDVYALWEKKTNEDSDRSDLETLIDHINTVPDDQYYDFARKTFDYNRMVDIIAMNMLIGNGSTYYHNYYMYHDPATSKWTMLPWDLDRTLSAYGTGLQYNRSTSITHPDNPFLERALLCEPIMANITQRLQELSETVFNVQHLGPVIDSIKSVLAASVEQDTSDLNESLDKWYLQLEREKEYINNRYKAVRQQIASYPRTFRVVPTEGILTLPLRLSWFRSSDPNGDELTYKVRISRDPVFPEAVTLTFDNLTDTTLTVTTLPSEGPYYWIVTVTDGQSVVEGYDKHQSFVYHTSSPLPSPITGIVVLTKERSPYIADGDIIVESGAWLRAEPGAELRMKEARSIIVYGGVEFTGTASDPVTLTAMPDVPYWNSMNFREGSMPSTLKNVVVGHGTQVDKADDIYRGKIDVSNGTLTLDSVTFIKCRRGITARHSNLSVLNCNFPAGNFDELINVLGGSVLIENCELHQAATTPDGIIADAIDIDSAEQAIVRYNRIFGAEDDGIDIGRSTAMVVGNEIHDCRDKGISLGENANVTVLNNVITSCHAGIGVKSGASAQVDRTTLYNNAQGCAASDGGSISIVNTIIAQSQEVALFVEGTASIQASYSLSDTDVLPGTSSLLGNPQFVDAQNSDFHLLAASPCIDAGDPASPADADGTRADIGAFSFSKIASATPVVINEIAYNPDKDTDTDDWVELYNPSDEPVDLSGWVFKDEDDSHAFTFPNNTLLMPHGYIVICSDTVKFRTVFPDVHPVVGNTGFGLAGGGELVRLYDNNNNIVDSLTYDDTDPWPTEPDGNGPTLELISPDYDNALGQSWKGSKENNGTPGAINSNTTNNVSTSGETTMYFLNQNYPNPFADQSTIDYVLLKPAHVDIEVYDATGRPVQMLYSGQLPSGKFTAGFHATGLPSGQYLYTLRINGKIVKTRSATVVR